jgi:hypothetical protein
MDAFDSIPNGRRSGRQDVDRHPFFLLVCDPIPNGRRSGLEPVLADGTLPTTLRSHPERAAFGTVPFALYYHPERSLFGTPTC